MKKAVIAIAALAAAAGISVGTLIAFKNKSEKAATEESASLADNVLFQLNSDDIQKLDIESAGVSYTIEQIDGSWEMTSTSADIFDLNQVTLQGVCGYMSSMTADTSYGDAAEENKAKYGLDDPYIITAYDSNGAHTLYVGDQSPTGDYYYVCTGEKNSIYAVSTADVQPVLTDRMLLKNDEFTDYNSGDIVGLTLKRDGETIYDLTYDDDAGEWKMPEEYSILDLDQSVPSNAVLMLARLSAEFMVEDTPDDIELYGFDKPYAEFTLTMRDGNQEVVLISDYAGMSSDYIYTYLERYKQVEAYYRADLSFVTYDLFDLVTKTVGTANILTVSEVEVSGDIINDKFVFDQDNKKVTCRGAELDLANAEIYSFFETFYNSFSYFNIDAIDIEAQPELKDPVLTAKYTLNNGRKKQIDLVDAGNDMCYVFVEGEYTGTLMSKELLSGTTGVSANYASFCTIAGIEQNT
ncbi:MAG: DUF4340 domain-containing protein [Ruminococcus sp.]|nr:DUF4340 domain-containing protein [Ruminococcus sp.]